MLCPKAAKLPLSAAIFSEVEGILLIIPPVLAWYSAQLSVSPLSSLVLSVKDAGILFKPVSSLSIVLTATSPAPEMADNRPSMSLSRSVNWIYVLRIAPPSGIFYHLT
jgi:hypothetical protein